MNRRVSSYAISWLRAPLRALRHRSDPTQTAWLPDCACSSPPAETTLARSADTVSRTRIQSPALHSARDLHPPPCTPTLLRWLYSSPPMFDLPPPAPATPSALRAHSRSACW